MAILGTGNIAGAHAAAVRARPGDADLVAAADVDRARLTRFCDEHGIAGRYGSLAELLDAEWLDLIHLCTPPGTHTEQAVRCLEAGTSVLCEKPPCPSLADLDRVEAAERRGGAHFVTVFQHRFGSSGRRVKALIEAGELGRPLVAVCNTLWYRDQAYFDVPWRGRWDTEGGGPTLGHGIHQLDLLGWLLGDWTEVSATAARLDRDLLTEDVSVAHVRFASGAVASVVNSVLSPRQETYLRFDLADATVELTHLYGYGRGDWRFTPAPGTPPERVERWRLPDPDVPSGHAALIAEVLAALRQGRRPEPGSATARATLELVTGLYAAALGGGRVRRQDLTPASPFYHALHGGQPDPFRGGSGARSRAGFRAASPAAAGSGAGRVAGGELRPRVEWRDRAVSLVASGVELFRYVHAPDDARVESPRPYLHPVRTLDGDLVTIYRPHDHVWHRGISLALPYVGEAGSWANFWGGVTFQRGAGYVQLPNNGSVRHVAFDAVTCDGGVARIDQRLRWVTEQGETWIEETRRIAATVAAAERAWILGFRTRLRNVRGRELRFGSPTTEGRPLAGYGGLFWRGPRSFTGGTLLAPDGGGEALMGRRAPWLAFVGRHDEVGRASTVAFVDHPGNPGHPTEWFVRSTPFAAVCPAPFFSAELELPHGDSLHLSYHVVIGAGAWHRARVARVLREHALPLDLLADQPEPAAGAAAG